MRNKFHLIPLAVDAKTAAHLCGVGISLWYELAAEGRTPPSIQLHSKKLWSYKELERWIAAGCPNRGVQK